MIATIYAVVDDCSLSLSLSLSLPLRHKENSFVFFVWTILKAIHMTAIINL